MKVLIIEDELPAAEHLIRLLGRLDEDITVLQSLTSVFDSARWIKQNPPPDLIFMDIQLNDGISFSIFDRIEVQSPIIFTTAYDKYALDAFKVNSIDYLLKPIALEDLRRAIRKLKSLQSQDQQKPGLNSVQFKAILKELKPAYKQRFLVKAGNHLKSIPVAEILAFQSREKITFLVNDTGRKYPVDYSLNDLEDLLDPDLFFRINRQDMISHAIITDVITYTSHRLKIKSKHFKDSEMIVSRDRVSEFRFWLDK
jgi:DNA-binding LytR/AlgR family response regulator